MEGWVDENDYTSLNNLLWDVNSGLFASVAHYSSLCYLPWKLQCSTKLSFTSVTSAGHHEPSAPIILSAAARGHQLLRTSLHSKSDHIGVGTIHKDTK